METKDQHGSRVTTEPRGAEHMAEDIGPSKQTPPADANAYAPVGVKTEPERATKVPDTTSYEPEAMIATSMPPAFCHGPRLPACFKLWQKLERISAALAISKLTCVIVCFFSRSLFMVVLLQ
ncbi:hypothetical protein GUJ93_ZPchr0121g61 [Zizania palustris]|uniref:Uncharacterized protein n=1 Tax=Zizania palustris TaxID=103762 RepID=A0A8J5QW16_ZIZPA|nr:hypothetical protein GUJ93_ZPchr0121g61 [Zizania palustris]